MFGPWSCLVRFSICTGLKDFIPDPDVQSTAAFKGGATRVRKHQQVKVEPLNDVERR